tara:strand:- start:564 stop:761 length:198 start_codon:yes stop_codon:yes gene_type:complete
MANTFTDWLKKEADAYNNERKKIMKTQVKEKVAMVLNAKQKKGYLIFLIQVIVLQIVIESQALSI